MGFAPHTDEDVAGMLEVIGLSSMDELFAQIPRDGTTGPAARHPRGRLRDGDPGRPRGPRGTQPEHRRSRVFRRRWGVRPLRAGGRLAARGPIRVLHLVHALPAGALAGRAPGPVRVPVDDLRADRARGVERVAVRRRDGARRGREPRPVDAGPRSRAGERGRRPEVRRDPAHVWQGRRLRAGALRRRGRPGRRARGRRRRGLRDRAAPERLRPPRARARPVRDGARGRGPRDPRVRPALARRPRAARRPPGRHRGRGGPRPREPHPLRRPVPRPHRDPPRRRAAHARPDRGRDAGHRRTDRLRAHAPGPRAAHPTGEGHEQHLHEPDAHGDRGDDLPRRGWDPKGSRSWAGSAPRRPRTPPSG